MKVINFSGGQSSALMTIIEYQKGDLVLFTDTGRESPETYKFIDDFEKHENIPVTRIRHELSFHELFAKKKILPNVTKRICTVELKINTAKRYVRKTFGFKSHDWLIGFRNDEEKRVNEYSIGVKYLTPYFPLYTLGIDLRYVNSFWNNKPYKLECSRILGNCDLCFLKGKNAIMNIMRHRPETAAKWIEDEEKVGGTYIQGISYKTLFELSQNDLFKGIELEELKPAFNCQCGV